MDYHADLAGEFQISASACGTDRTPNCVPRLGLPHRRLLLASTDPATTTFWDRPTPSPRPALAGHLPGRLGGAFGGGCSITRPRKANGPLVGGRARKAPSGTRSR